MSDLSEFGIKKYTKKPVTIEAMRWSGTHDDWTLVAQWLGGDYGVEAELNEQNHSVRIHTLEGDMYAMPGDYIIKGVKDEFYPCKPDIFAETYVSA